MIELQDVTFAYPFHKALFAHLCACFDDGERRWITGPSGSGKTTLLRLITGLENPKKGRVIRPEGYRFSVMFQENRLIPTKTVLQNVTLFATESAAREWLGALLDESVLSCYPRELSGGMKRRVALARALAHESDAVVLDEAFTGLDEATKQLALSVTQRALKGRTLFLVDHDEAVAQSLQAVPFPLPL